MNQTKLASEVGKSPSWLSGFLKGETGIGFDVLDDLARALHVEVPDLFVDRDQLRHGSYVQQVLHPLLKGAPSDPAARATFIREILEAYELLSATLLDIAATAVGGEAPRAEPAQTGHAPRPRIGRGSRIGKLKGRQS
jgi:transcriptional regulator with XRE-family HTH domain